jgi:hypothetical protein
MGYSYGLKQCRDTLLYLSSEQPFDERMVKAFSEIGVIQSDDVSQQHYNEIQQWRKKYLSITKFAIDDKGVLKEIDKENELRNLANEIVWLCVEIIEHNSRNTKKQDL